MPILLPILAYALEAAGIVAGGYMATNAAREILQNNNITSFSDLKRYINSSPTFQVVKGSLDIALNLAAEQLGLGNNDILDVNKLGPITETYPSTSNTQPFIIDWPSASNTYITQETFPYKTISDILYNPQEITAGELTGALDGTPSITPEGLIGSLNSAPSITPRVEPTAPALPELSEETKRRIAELEAKNEELANRNAELENRLNSNLEPNEDKPEDKLEGLQQENPQPEGLQPQGDSGQKGAFQRAWEWAFGRRPSTPTTSQTTTSSPYTNSGWRNFTSFKYPNNWLGNTSQSNWNTNWLFRPTDNFTFGNFVTDAGRVVLGADIVKGFYDGHGIEPWNYENTFSGRLFQKIAPDTYKFITSIGLPQYEEYVDENGYVKRRVKGSKTEQNTVSSDTTGIEKPEQKPEQNSDKQNSEQAPDTEELDAFTNWVMKLKNNQLKE